MSELGIIPAPADAYVELAGQGGARRFRKHVLSVGETFVHPATGRPLTVDESWWADLKRNWDDKVCPIVQFPAADAKNSHTEDPRANLGRVTGLSRQAEKIYVDIEVPDPEIASKVGSTILGASAMISMDYRDSRSGARRGKTLCHVAATNRPHLVALDPYQELAASDTQLWETFGDGSSMPPRLLMLCASDVADPVMLAEPEPDFTEPEYGGPGMHDDFLRSEIDRLSTEALYVSSGRPTKPSYDHVTVQREHEARQQAAGLTAEAEITEEDCTGAGMRLAGLTGQEFSDIMAAARELAFARDEQTAREPASVAAGLLELTAKLGRSVEDLRPDSLLELSCSAEMDRLADDDSMLALTHPRPGSGKPVTTKTRAHSNQLADYEDPSDEDQPGRAGEVHRKIRELIERHPDLLTDGEGHEGGSGNRSDRPKTPAQREAGERRSLAGGRPGKRSIGDLRPRTGPGTSGSVRA